MAGDFASDKNGHVFMGTERGGLNVFNPETNTFRHIPENSKSTIKSLLTDKNGMLWVGTFREGLKKYDPDRETFYSFPKPSQPFAHLQEASINDMTKNDCHIWIATDKDGGIFKFDPNTNKFIDFVLMDTLHHLMEKIMYNLLSNAIKFNKPGGKTNVKLSNSGYTSNQTFISLIVEDTGKGIEPEKKDKTFQRFYNTALLTMSKYTRMIICLPRKKRTGMASTQSKNNYKQIKIEKGKI